MILTSHLLRRRDARLCAVLAVGALLAGCNSTRTTTVAVSAPAPASYATQPYTPPGFQLPSGSGCSADIARWKAIQDNDYASGNVSLKIYNQIKSEISGAAATCSAGQDAQASAMVEASRHRHGYPD